MRNQYPGVCYRCGNTVEPGDGHFERYPGGPTKWRLQHATCAIQHRGTDVAVDPDQQRRIKAQIAGLRRSKAR